MLPDDLLKLVKKAKEDATSLALEAISDDGVPIELHQLSLTVQSETGQRITAVKRGEHSTWGPATPIPNMTDRLDWGIRRIIGKPLANDPQCVEHRREGYYFVVDGNPIIVEYWLKRHGFPDASCGSPAYCYVCDA